MSQPIIGFAGIGAMGKPMAINLTKAALSVAVSDPNTVATGVLAQHGAEVVEGARALADRAEVVHLCLPSVPIAELVVADLAKGGAVRHVVNHGTTGSAFSQAAAANLSEKGIAFLDAPISGGVAGAESGALVIMCSGNTATFEVTKPGLEAMSRQITYLGEAPGAAQVMKLCNNILMFCNFAAALESLTLGVKAGLDPEQMMQIVNAATGRSVATETLIPDFVLNRRFDFGGANHIIEKDLELWRREVEAHEVPAMIGTVVRTIYRQMFAEEGRDSDITRLTLPMERLAQTEIPKTR